MSAQEHKEDLKELMVEVVRLDARIRRLKDALKAAADRLDYHGYWNDARRAREAMNNAMMEGSTDVEWR